MGGSRVGSESERAAPMGSSARSGKAFPGCGTPRWSEVRSRGAGAEGGAAGAEVDFVKGARSTSTSSGLEIRGLPKSQRRSQRHQRNQALMPTRIFAMRSSGGLEWCSYGRRRITLELTATVGL